MQFRVEVVAVEEGVFDVFRAWPGREPVCCRGCSRAEAVEIAIGPGVTHLCWQRHDGQNEIPEDVIAHATAEGKSWVLCDCVDAVGPSCWHTDVLRQVGE